MLTISLRLNDRLSRKLTAVARASGISKSELVRKCLSDHLAALEETPNSWELGKRLFGCYDSGQGNLSERAGMVASEKVHAKRTAMRGVPRQNRQQR